MIIDKEQGIYSIKKEPGKETPTENVEKLQLRRRYKIMSQRRRIK